jgi:hypothetical protein
MSPHYLSETIKTGLATLGTMRWYKNVIKGYNYIRKRMKSLLTTPNGKMK